MDDQQRSYPRNNFRSTRGRNTFNNTYREREVLKSNHSEGNLTFMVPARMTGKIIGRGGSQISELQRESNAKIIVCKEEINGERSVTLIGDDSSVEKAKMLIDQLLNSDDNSRSGLAWKDQRREQQPVSYFSPPPVNINPIPYNQPVAPAPVEQSAINWDELREEADRYEAEKLQKMTPIVKNFYVELPEVKNLSQKEVTEFRLERNNICVARTFEDPSGKGKPIPNPVKTFYQAFHNYPEILEEINKAGFTTPSPIQCQAWPILLSGEDMIGIAQTGTGKTLAFLLPALIHINGQHIPLDERKGPTVLILAPTRELALQIEREVRKYYYKGIKSVCVYGGGDRREQVKAVKAGVDIVIATPGRLNDLVEAKIMDVEGVSYAVLDEADRMLDMGFEPQIRKIMYQVRKDRQTCMTSATWPNGVRRLAQSYMVNPIQVYVGSLELAAVHSVTQSIVMISEQPNEKFQLFLQFCQTLQPDQKVIVFCGKKITADQIASELAMLMVDYQVIHGGIDQSDREQAIRDISDGTVNILIATDVASRGIDIDDITHVLNYDFPHNIEEYVHRVGRTGRAGRTGDSISYFSRADWAQAEELIKILEEAGQYVPEELSEMSRRFAQWKKRKEEQGTYRGQRSRWYREKSTVSEAVCEC